MPGHRGRGLRDNPEPAAPPAPPTMDTASAPDLPPRGARARRHAIPAFALYGEAGDPAAPGLLHIEDVQSRSERYQWEIDTHVHPGLHQLLWLRAGSAEVSLDETRQRCEGPAVVLIPPGVVHSFRFSPGTDGHVFTFGARALVEGDAADAREAGEALRLLFEAPRVLTLERDAPETRRADALLGQLLEEGRAPDPPESPVPLWLARAALWRLARIGALRERLRGPGAQRHHALFTRFVVLLEAHYLEHWPVSRYAAQLGLTPERLNRLAQAQAGRNALALIHERLGREACRRLVHVAAPISRLAFELGFEDPAYFCRFFKRRTGLSPRDYRMRHGGGEEREAGPDA